MRHVSLIFLLFAANAVRAQGISQEYAIEQLDERGFVENRSIDSDDLVRQSAEGHLENVLLFLAAGVRPDVRDDEGWYALLRAVDKNHLDVVQALIAAGADLEVRDRVGRTAFVIATTRGHLDVLNVLLRARGN